MPKHRDSFTTPQAPRKASPAPKREEPPVVMTPDQMAVGRQRVADLLVAFAPASSDDPIAVHAERLQGRGMDEGPAWSLAKAMSEDPAHVAHCPLCQQHPERPGQAAMRRMELEQASRRGMQHIAPTLARIAKRRP